MNIVAAIDLSEHSPSIVGQAKKLALGLSSRLWLVHVVEPIPEFLGSDVDISVMREVLAERYRDEHRQLLAFAETMRECGIDCTALMVAGEPVEMLLKEAERLGAEMMVIGSHGHGPLRQLLLGSVSEGVIRKSPIPLHVVPTR